MRFARVPSRYNHENNSGLQWSGWSVANIRPKYKHFPIPTAANLPSWAEMEKLYSIITKCWDFLLLHFVKFPFCLSTQGEVCGRPAARNTNTSFVCGETNPCLQWSWSGCQQRTAFTVHISHQNCKFSIQKCKIETGIASISTVRFVSRLHWPRSCGPKYFMSYSVRTSRLVNIWMLRTR